MAKRLLQEVTEYIHLYRDDRTGIAWVENGSSGNEHSAHPNIDATGSVSGMKKLGYWDRDDVTVRLRGTIYNVSKVVVTDELDELAYRHCRCEGCRE